MMIENDDISPLSDGMLTLNDDLYPGSLLLQLNTLRKNGQFCDVILEIEGHEIQAHKCVLACASQYLYDLMSSDPIDPTSTLSHYKLKGFRFEIFEKLVNYAYTSRLEANEDEIKAIYKVARQLKMPRISDECSKYLAKHLTPTNCIGIRAFVNSHTDAPLTMQTDNYIQQNFDDVRNSPEFLALPRIQVDILAEDQQLNTSNEIHISQLVNDWVKKEFDSGKDIDTITELVNLLYFDTDNTLRDCQNVTDDDLKQTEIIQDYVKNKKRNETFKNSTKDKSSPPRPMVSKVTVPKYLCLSSDDLLQEDKQECKVVTTSRVLDKRLLCLAVLQSTPVAICIQFRHYQARTNSQTPPLPEGGKAYSTGSNSPVENGSPTERHASLIPLAGMNAPRCGVGLAVLDGDVIALGGYDRGECLRTVVSYNMHTNEWKPHSDMTTARGRFDVSQLGGKLYACGGSDGIRDLRSVEVYHPADNKWSRIADMKCTRSSPGVAILDGKLYCVGGWSGQTSVVECEVYDPNTDKWSNIAPLNIARSQAAVCTMGGCLYVIGGSTSWNCLNSVEVYDPNENKWVMTTPINVSRRGAGVCSFKGKIFVVGGSDGTSALASVEIFDPEQETWTFGPSLSTCRANVGVTVVRNWLFAVGGFSGKAFLDSMEFLDLNYNEWWSYLPQEAVLERELSKVKL